VREGRGILDNIRKFLRYLLSSNMGEVLTVFLAVLGARAIGLIDSHGAVALPLLATQILWINLITDSAPALAMGVDPQDRDLMTRPPRRPTDRVIDARMWWGVLQIGVVMAAATLSTLDLLLPGGWIHGDQTLDTARTAAFTVLVLAQLFNAFNARSETTSAFRGLFDNRWLWASAALGVGLQVAVVELPLLNTAFSTTPLSVAQWALCLAMASSVLWFGELRKFWLRRGDAARMRVAAARAQARVTAGT
jgi:magnesium-transporting ATPase (P-type)